MWLWIFSGVAVAWIVFVVWYAKSVIRDLRRLER